MKKLNFHEAYSIDENLDSRLHNIINHCGLNDKFLNNYYSNLFHVTIMLKFLLRDIRKSSKKGISSYASLKRYKGQIEKEVWTFKRQIAQACFPA